MDTCKPIVVSRILSSSMESVFDAWLDPDLARHFLFATPGTILVRTDINPKIGGGFIITRREAEDIEHIGTYVEINRPTRLAFSFVVPLFSNQETEVQIDIQSAPSGCLLTLVHKGVPTEWQELAPSGWETILSQLANLLAKNSSQGIKD